VTIGRRTIVTDLSVVIPTLGRWLLEGCLEALLSGTSWPAEVIVVDQSSSAEVAAWVDQLCRSGMSARHVPSTQRGIAAGTNRGVELVRTRYVAVTHDDCRARPDWIARLGRRLGEVGDVVLTGQVQPEGDGHVPTTVTAAEAITYRKPLRDRDVLFPANMGLALRVFDRVGRFDEHPLLNWAAEDNDWAYRALRGGVPIVYDPGLVVGHLAWRSAAEIAATYRRYAFGQGAFYAKHIQRGDLFLARRAARDLARGPWLVMRGAWSGNAELLQLGRAEVAGIGPGLVAGLRRSWRRESPGAMPG
jgi:GT2 family glycosyltransferase